MQVTVLSPVQGMVLARQSLQLLLGPGRGRRTLLPLHQGKTLGGERCSQLCC